MHLGGALGLEAGFGRKLRAHKVTGDQLPDYVEKLSRTYLERARGRRVVRPLGRPRRRGGPPLRGIPFHCPYCADEDLRPHGEKHGEWECRSCLRAFRLGFIGQLAPTDLTTL